MVELSIVIPVYYSEKSIAKLCDALVIEMDSYLKDQFEIILVNDGSKDNSDKVCQEIVKKYGNIVRYYELAKNFGEHSAIIAGFNQVKGKFAIIVQDDFQQPPSEIKKMYDKINESGADVVFAKYKKKKHSWLRNLGSRFNDKVANIILSKPKNLYLAPFKIVRQNLLHEIIKYKAPYPYIDGLILRNTTHIETQLVEHAARDEGESHYTFSKSVSLWSNMFVNFSVKPLRIALFLGFLFAFMGLGLGIYFFIEKMLNPKLVMGWTSLIVSTLIFSGIQLLVLGIIGEFLGRLYLSETGKPQYVIRNSYGDKKQ